MSDIMAVFGAPWIAAVLLLSARFSAVFLMTPVFHTMPIPITVRLLLVMGLAASLALPFAGNGVPVTSGLGALAASFVREVAIGATLGLGVLMAFSGFAIAGRILDVQVGFGIGQVFDPLTRTQVPVLTSAFGLFGVLLFFLVNGHHALLRGIAYSLERFPIGQPWTIEAVAGPVLRQAAGLFTLGFALAAPVVLCLLLMEFALGVVARNLPQMNMFVLGIPVKIVAGLLALSVWAGGMGEVSLRIYAQIYKTWTAMLDQAPATPGGR
jgi:flagellar biosynthesis protein FliR